MRCPSIKSGANVDPYRSYEVHCVVDDELNLEVPNLNFNHDLSCQRVLSLFLSFQ